MGGNHEHFIGYQPCAARRCAKADSGENVGIVALARHEGLAVELYRIKRAAACEQGAAASLSIGFLGRAFRLRGRIGEREHDRSLVEHGHGLQHFGRERAADRCDADDRGGLERIDGGEEMVDRRLIVRVAKLVLGEAHAILDDEAARIHQPIAPDGLGFGQPFSHHG